MVFNASRPPFDDPRARKAVALALDPNDINKIAFTNQGVPGTSIFPSDSPLVAPEPPACPPPTAPKPSASSTNSPPKASR
ncbi:ABC transporter substrate-binding protein [Yinghuangia aomiensis]